MKKTLLMFITLIFFSCDSNNFVKTDNQQVIITDFSWGGNPNEWGSMWGDFSTIDEEIYNSLKGKSGVFSIVIINSGADQYGNQTTSEYTIGSIDANELNKYQSWGYWANGTGGTLEIFANYIGMKR